MSNKRLSLLPLLRAIIASLFVVACSTTEESADGRQRNAGLEPDCDVDPTDELATEQPGATLVSANSSTTEYVAPTTTEYVAPATTEYVAPATTEYVAPTTTEYVAPTTTEYVAPTTTTTESENLSLA